MKRPTARVVKYNNDPDPLEVEIRIGITDWFLDRHELDDPGVRMAVFEVARMLRWGVPITQEIVEACIAECAESEARHAARGPDLTGNHDPLVYYVQHGTLVKIGTTINLKNRVYSFALRMEHVRATEPGGPDVEKARHRQFAAYRSHGEWYHLVPEIQEHIEALTQAAA